MNARLARVEITATVYMAVPNSGSLFNLVDKKIRVKYVAVHVGSVLLQ
jgi:hypothetical protein